MGQVGFGDIQPVTQIEVVFATIVMLIGGAFYGYGPALRAAAPQSAQAPRVSPLVGVAAPCTARRALQNRKARVQ
jgi:hypothetical protein